MRKHIVRPVELLLRDISRQNKGSRSECERRNSRKHLGRRLARDAPINEKREKNSTDHRPLEAGRLGRLDVLAVVRLQIGPGVVLR